MAKDYKNTPKPKDKASKAAPGWLWLLAGLSIGLFVALLVYLKDASLAKGVSTQGASTSAPAPVVEKGRAAEPSTKTAKDDAKDKKPRFDFYNLLPEMEVFIPEQELAAEREHGSTEPVVYYLQVGSFRRFEDADRLRAKLALQSIESEIQRVTINDTQTWHRVRVGPFSSARKMGKVRNQLRAQSLDPIVLKRRVDASAEH
jgi:cell division protein FtsN